MKKSSVVDLLEKLGGKTILPSGQNIQISCPFALYSSRHKSEIDARPSMGILVREDDTCLVNCFTCGAKFGSLVPLIEKLMEFNNERYEPLLEEAKAIEDTDIDLLLDSMDTYRVWGSLVEDNELPEEYFSEYVGLWHPYLERRGIRKEIGKVWGVGFDSGRKRVVIPVRNKENKLVGGVGRCISSTGMPKYLNYWKFDKGKFLLGAQLVGKDTAVILVEGPLDALVTFQHLFDLGILPDYSVVCSMGAKLTPTQVNKLVSLTHEVIVAFDNDDAGRMGTDYLVKKLARRVICKGLSYQSYMQDPGSLNKEDFCHLLSNARLLF